MKILAAALAAAVLLPLAAEAGQTIPVPPFRGIDLHGGGEAVLVHGNTQRVVLLQGDPKIAEIRVVNGTLQLSPCGKLWGCPWHTELKVEITTPGIAAVAVHGGGELKAQTGFAEQPSLSVDVHGGGDADLRALPARSVSASVHGGGDAEVTATHQLSAAVHGGGELRYWGHPATLATATHGGGSIEAGE